MNQKLNIQLGEKFARWNFTIYNFTIILLLHYYTEQFSVPRHFIVELAERSPKIFTK